MEPSSNMQEPHGLTRRSCVSTREASSNTQEPRNSLDLWLYLKWHGEEGQSQIHRLKLSSLDKVESLQALPKQLVSKAYERRAMPEHFTSAAYQKFTPQTQYLSIPGSIVRTNLWLVLHHEGWEYTVLKRDLGGLEQDQNRTLLMSVVEFVRRTNDPLLGRLSLQLPMIAYPVVSLKKDFLHDLEERLRADPEGFRGSF